MVCLRAVSARGGESKCELDTERSEQSVSLSGGRSALKYPCPALISLLMSDQH